MVKHSSKNKKGGLYCSRQCEAYPGCPKGSNTTWNHAAQKCIAKIQGGKRIRSKLGGSSDKLYDAAKQQLIRDSTTNEALAMGLMTLGKNDIPFDLEDGFFPPYKAIQKEYYNDKLGLMNLEGGRRRRRKSRKSRKSKKSRKSRRH